MRLPGNSLGSILGAAVAPGAGLPLTRLATRSLVALGGVVLFTRGHPREAAVVGIGRPGPAEVGWSS